MDSTEENSNMPASRLRPPSQFPSPGKGLSEISESQGNARSKPSMMHPPSSIKHKLTYYSEPEPKRITLAEQAGQPIARSMATAIPIKRQVAKATSLMGLGKNAFSRTASVSSASSKTSLSSRNTSHGSFSSSVGQNNRPQTSYNNRAGSSFSQSTMTRNTSRIPNARPATAMEHHLEGNDISGSGGRGNGTASTSIPYCDASSQAHSTLRSRKTRGQPPSLALGSSQSRSQQRDSSLSTAMARLKLDGEDDFHDFDEHQAISFAQRPRSKTTQPHKPSISRGPRNQRHNSSETALVLYEHSGDSLVAPKTPSQIPVPSKMEAWKDTPATPCKMLKKSPNKNQFLTKDSNVTAFVADFNVSDRLEQFQNIMEKFEETLTTTTYDKNALEEALAAYKARIVDLESFRDQLQSTNQSLQHDLETMRQKAEMLQQRLLTVTANLDASVRAHHVEIDDLKRECQNEVDQTRREKQDEVEKLLRLHRDDLRKYEQQAVAEVEERMKELERRNEANLEDERSRRRREVQELESKIASETQNVGLELQKKELELQNLRTEIQNVKSDLDREQKLKANAQNEVLEMKEVLKKTGIDSASTIHSLEGTLASLRARIHFLESGSKAQSDSFAEMESRLQEAIKSAEVSKQKLIKEETLRRILFNQVQELKGNIRVMCRVRPVFGAENDTAKISFPDIDRESKELAILGKEEKSSLGTITRKNHSFTFDRVFGPESQNQEVFEEISQLVQSALDGYNVCIFCYGQTGSGKTHTMSSEDGMIPRATHQIYETATNLKDKGWEYIMEGSFVEVYNEEIHDLLGNSNEKKKHDIRHDDAKKQTTVTGLKTVALDSPNTVETMLKQAAINRSVAATKSNEHSSRSHSVFILKLVGHNSTTGETSEGTLNLVDLAGSERLKQSGAEGDRMKETQNINKSLSCLGDVIAALGAGKDGGHIPYRNSKLTYLLQYSLGGNSKTLMFVMASPLEAHLTETITSLKFATKVHNTHIGTAKKSTKGS